MLLMITEGDESLMHTVFILVELLKIVWLINSSTKGYEPHVIVEGETEKWERIAQAHMSSMMTKTSIPFAWFHENKEESKKQSGVKRPCNDGIDGGKFCLIQDFVEGLSCWLAEEH
ncbi:hypothetical protein P8452_27031 [Trifolium repens]|nr:hypothetical protein P8452_27031 [Trifolium repens]